MNDYPKFLSKEEINALPMFDYNGRIELIETSSHAERAMRELAGEKLLGFDTETRPSFQKGESYPVALIQISTQTCAYLFRLNKISMPKELISLLSDPSVIKTGVGIQDDLKGLRNFPGFDPKGFVDLSKEAEKRGFTSLGLRALTGIFLKQRLSKAAKVTNWDRPVLSPAQIKYAAADAYVGLKIYEILMKC